MDHEKIKKQLKDFNISMKTEGIFCINSTSGEVVLGYGSTPESEKLIASLVKNKEFDGLNSQFNSIFYDRGFPEIIAIENENQSRFIKFLDKAHFIYAIVKKKSLNYIKVKSRLNQIKSD